MFLLAKIIFYLFLYNVFKILVFKINLSSEYLSDFPILNRINNGYYIVLTNLGIYLYDENLNSNKIIKSFDFNITKNFEDKIVINFNQFLSEDNGYIIYLINNKIYFFSKSAEFLTEYNLEFFNKTNEYSIIGYNHLNDEYFFVIFSEES